MDIPTTGEYYLGEVNVTAMDKKQRAQYRNKNIGFILQDYALIEYYSTYRNIELPLIYGKQKNRRSKIQKIAEQLGIEEKLTQEVRFLSGGQKQRVAIARALINDAGIILADEPTGALDLETGGQVVNLLRQFNQQGKTIIIVTHNQEIADQCNRCIILTDGKQI